jgi:hypothetical protein
MDLHTLRAFRGELEKRANALTAVQRVGRFVSQSPARTALMGGAAGAVAGGVRGAVEAPGGEGLRGAVGGALTGGVAGAALGGGVGHAGRAYRDTHLLSKTPLSATQAIAGTAQRFGAGVKQFAKRQVHGITGRYADPTHTGLASTATSAKKIDLLERRLQDELQHARPDKAQALRKAHSEEVAALREHGERGDAALRGGVTSIPGVAKGLWNKETRGETAKQLWHANTGGKLLSMGGAAGVGLPVAFGAYDLSKGDESSTGGRTVGQKLVNVGTNVGVGALTAGLPVGAQMLTGMAADAAGQRLLPSRWKSRADLRGQLATAPLDSALEYTQGQR